MVALQKGHFPRNNCKIKQYRNCGSPHGGSPAKTCKSLKHWCRGGPVCSPVEKEQRRFIGKSVEKMVFAGESYYEKTKKLDMQQIETLSMALFDIKDSKELEEYL